MYSITEFYKINLIYKSLLVEKLPKNIYYFKEGKVWKKEKKKE